MARVVAVSLSAEHRFSKTPQRDIELVAGVGVRGDCHACPLVQHRSRDPRGPNLRQVHLLSIERLRQLDVQPGDLGENVLVRGLDLHALAVDTVVHLGGQARIRLTGLRNPCAQIEAFRPGLLAQVGRLAGVMAVVEAGGRVAPGDLVQVHEPDHHVPLARV